MLESPALVSGVYQVTAVAGREFSMVGSAIDGSPLLQGRLSPKTEDGTLEPRDVVHVAAGQRRAVVGYRASDRHHTLFVTNQCNSRCLMCSQPPTRQGDGWLYQEAIETLSLIDAPPDVVGVTGGEPTLNPGKLRELLDLAHARWPDTTIEVLTNARRLGHSQVAEVLLSGLRPARTTWLVPLYGATDEVHDYVVQAPGAFDETVGGLLQLQAHSQAIQIRIVLIRPVIDQLTALCEFIGKNFPFAQAVALMGTEPIGYALANPELCLVDPAEHAQELVAAVDMLRLYGLGPVLMNLPLCKLPKSLHRYAAVSISDWKNEYAPECAPCQLKPRCCGFFVWDKSSIYRAGIKPQIRIEHV